MSRRFRLSRAMLLGILLLSCSPETPLGSVDDGGTGTGSGNPTLHPATFRASVNPDPPPGFQILGEAPFQWQAFFYHEGAWVAAGPPRFTETPATRLVINCNDPALLDACTLHRQAMIQVTVRDVSPGPTLLCAYKSGFAYYDDFLLSTPVGTLSVAPAATTGQDPANQGTCFP